MDSLVDIVVAVYGGADFLTRCLFALKRTLRDDANVFIVDDATPTDRQEGLSKVYERLPSFARLILNETNVGFAATNNVGAAKGNAPYICLLNSDTEPQDGWLQAMVSLIESDPKIGVIGARMVFPPWSTDPIRPKGMIQHAGVVFNTARLPYHIFLGWDPTHPKVSQRKEFQSVTGACCLIRRELYEAIGGLDEKYRIGNFEDIAFCLAAIQKGYKIIYEPRAFLWHFGSGSNNTQDATRNMGIFTTDWYDLIEPDDYKFW